jgi:hypothetical protein
MRVTRLAIAAAAALLAGGVPSLAPGEQFTKPLGMALIVTGVDEVQRRLGAAVVVESGHYEGTVCYYDDGTHTLLAFMAQGEELSGSFTAQRLKQRPAGKCSKLPQSALAQVNAGVGGLRLGMLRSEFIAVVGKAVASPEGALVATFEYPESVGEPAREIPTMVVVEGRFENDRLIEFVVTKSWG